MADSTRTIELPDGRLLGYCEFGDPDGTPVLYFHGWPACRLEGKLYHPAAVKSGVKLICADRPGFGVSTFQKGRALLDWPSDVELFADSLELEKVHILGHSGGGPFAAACAFAIPERIFGTAIVAGLSPMELSETREGMRKMNQFLLTVGKRFPWILDIMMGMTAKMSQNPEALLKGLKDLPDVDQKLIRESMPDVVEIMAGAFQQGTAAATCEGAIYAKPWGFDLDEIRSQVIIWQGSLDVNVPLSNCQIYADNIPNTSINLIEGEGHFSMAINQGAEIFKELIN